MIRHIKKTMRFAGLISVLTMAVSCSNTTKKMAPSDLAPPMADIKEKYLEMHGDVRLDPYYWLNDRDDEEVIDYLERENDYHQRVTAHTKDFQKDLFQEMKSRIKEDDASVPYFYNGYYYITRFEKGSEYPIYSRKKDSLSAQEEILFDVNKMAEGFAYYQLRGVNVSPDNKWVAFGVDTLSRRKYMLYIKNLETGQILPGGIQNTTGSSTWGNDNKTLFYTKKDPVTLRSDKIYRHIMGTPESEDIMVYHEEDETFNTFIYKTKSEQYLVIGSISTMSSEYRICSADDPHGSFSIVQPRERGLEYDIDHYQDHFYMVTNKDKSTNFKLMKTPVDQTSKEYWVDVIAHRDQVLLEDVDLFRDYLVVSEREAGLSRIRIMPWDGSDAFDLPFDNETYTAGTTQNIEFNTSKLRYRYSSLTTPASVIEFDMDTKTFEVLKETEVLGGSFDKNNYVSERIWAKAQDGTEIPVSLVYKKGFKKNGKSPLLQYGYGSYGATIDPYFSSTRLSLLDRGFVFAIAHLRGGQYMGRPWYESGKLLTKKNTFTDFIDVSRHLIEQDYTSSDHLYAMGGSAGGLLMGAVINMAPELYHGVIAAVPFVDVVTTMLDDSIPLTTGEFDEWGNPEQPEFYHYMKSYSPYDNVAPLNYPNLLVTTGLYDSQVQYWEPAKWVAKMRALKTGTSLLLLHTNMDAGHGGASGRFEGLRELAMEYAFLLDLEGIQR